MNAFRPFSYIILTCLTVLLPVWGQSNSMAPSGTAPAPMPAALAPTPNLPVDPAVDEVRQAYGLMQKGDLDNALTKLNDAIKLNPKLLTAYITRGGLYYSKKNWDLADKDFAMASQLDPSNIVVKFQLGEIKFQQKQYDAARPRFAVLQTDPDMSDFASYKVFLCDLFGGHIDKATAELDTFNKTGSRASYYFGNAAWDLYHKDIEGARGWLTSAFTIYKPGKNDFYAQSLRDLGYLPLPPPKAE